MALTKKLLVKDNPHSEALRNKFRIKKEDSWEVMKKKIAGEWVEPPPVPEVPELELESTTPIPPVPEVPEPIEVECEIDDNDDDENGDLF